MKKIKLFLITLLCVVGVMNVDAQDEVFTGTATTQYISKSFGDMESDANTWVSNLSYEKKGNYVFVDDDGTSKKGDFLGAAMSLNSAGEIVCRSTQSSATHVTIYAPLGWVIKEFGFNLSLDKHEVKLNDDDSERLPAGVDLAFPANSTEVRFMVRGTSATALLAEGATFHNFYVKLEKVSGLMTDVINDCKTTTDGVICDYDLDEHWKWEQECPVVGNCYKIVNIASTVTNPKFIGKNNKVVDILAESGDWFYGSGRTITNVFDKVVGVYETHVTIGSQTIGYTASTEWMIRPYIYDNYAGYSIHNMAFKFPLYLYYIPNAGSNWGDLMWDIQSKNGVDHLWNFYSMEQYECFIDFKYAYEEFSKIDITKYEEAANYNEVKAIYETLVVDLNSHPWYGYDKDSREVTREIINRMLDMIATINMMGGSGEDIPTFKGGFENPGAEDGKAFWSFSRTTSDNNSVAGYQAKSSKIQPYNGNNVFELRNASMSQQVEKLPAGVYTVTVRWKTSNNNASAVLRAESSAEDVKVALDQTKAKSVSNGYYETKLEVVVVDGRLTVSAKAETANGASVYLDDYTLDYKCKNYWYDNKETNTRIYRGVFDLTTEEYAYNEPAVGEIPLKHCNQLATATVTDLIPYADITKAYFIDFRFDNSDNPNGLCYAAAGKVIKGIDGGNPTNVIVYDAATKKGNCAQLALVDKHPFSTKDGFTATSASYTMKSFGQGNDGTHAKATYGTLMLPYIPNGLTLGGGASDDVKIYTIIYDANAKAISTKRVTSINDMKANTPYFVEIQNSIFEDENWNGISLSASAQPVAANIKNSYVTDANDATNCLVGLYDKKSVPNNKGNYALQVHGEKIAFYRVATDNVTGNTFRCYLHLGDDDPYKETQSAEALRFVFSDEDDATGINEIEPVNGNGAIYDLSGRRVETISRPGIYVQNGKKILVK